MGAFNIDYVNYKPREYVAQPLEALRATTESLESKHQSALQQENAVMQYMGSLDINDAEDQWRTDYVNNNIIAPIEQASQYGNMATAMTTATRIASKVASDPALRERVRYQKDFTDFKTSVQNSKDYDDNIKEYTIKHNPYAYQDKIDDKTGNVIGGARFEPIERPVTQHSRADLLFKANQMAAKEAGGSEQLHYVDSNGQFTTDINASADGVSYYKSGSSFERLPEEKIRAAYESLVATTPGARESIAQDYKVGVWKTQQAAARSGDLIVNDFTDERGMLLTQEQWEKKTTDPAFKSMAYINRHSTISPGAGLSVAWKKAQGKEAEAPMDIRSTAAIGGSLVTQRESLSTQMAQRDAVKTGYNDLLNDYGIQFDKSEKFDSRHSKAIASIKNNDNLSPGDKIDRISRLNDLYTRVNTYDAAINANPHLSNPETKAALEFAAAMESGGDIMELQDNNYVKEWNKANNKFWITDNGEIGETVKFTLPPAYAKDVVASLGEYWNKGYTVENSHTKEIHVTIPKTHSHLLAEFSGYLTAARESSKLITSAGAGGYSAPAYAEYGMQMLDKNGTSIKNYTASEARKTKTGRTLGIFPVHYTENQAAKEVGKVTEQYRKATERVNKSIGNSVSDQQFSNRTLTISGESDIVQAVVANESSKWSDANSYLKYRESMYPDLIAGADYAAHSIWAGAEGENLKAFQGTDKGDSQARIALGSIAQNLVGNKAFSYSFATVGGKTGTSFTINGSMLSDNQKGYIKQQLKKAGLSDKSANVKMFVENLFISEEKAAYDAQPHVASQRKITHFEDVASTNGKTVIPLLNNGSKTENLISQYGQYVHEYSDGTQSRPLTYNEATDLVSGYNIIQQAANTFNALNYTQSNINNDEAASQLVVNSAIEALDKIKGRGNYTSADVKQIINKIIPIQ